MALKGILRKCFRSGIDPGQTAVLLSEIKQTFLQHSKWHLFT